MVATTSITRQSAGPASRLRVRAHPWDQSEVSGSGGLSAGILRRGANFAEVFGGAAEFQFRGASVRAVGGNGHGRQIVFAIRQGEAEAERAVGTQFDFVPAQRDFGVGLGGAVNDQFGVDVEPETFCLLGWPPPNGLVGLAGTDRELEMPKAVTGEVTSCASRRRMSSVISSEPIQMRRVWSMLMIAGQRLFLLRRPDARRTGRGRRWRGRDGGKAGG